jgi:hypothetical protein
VFIFALAGTALLESQTPVVANLKIGYSGLALLALTVIDQAATGLAVSKRECKRRVAKMEAAMLQARGSRIDCNMFWVNQNNADPSDYKNLDTMLAGQALGINVVNGYSGLLPNGYPIGLASLQGDCCEDLRIWAEMHPGIITSKSLVQIGPSCQWSDSEHLPLPMRGFSGIEVGPPIHVWATGRVAELQVGVEPARQPDKVVVSFDLAALAPCTVRITGPGKRTHKIHLAPGSPQHVEIQLLPGASTKAMIRFHTDNDGVILRGGNRPFFFDLENPAERPAPVHGT